MVYRGARKPLIVLGMVLFDFWCRKTSISSIHMPYLATIRKYMIRAPKIPTIKKWCGQNHINFALTPSGMVLIDFWCQKTYI